MTVTTRPTGDAGTPPAGATPLPLQGFIMLALLSVVWGINWPIIKIALEGVPVLWFRTICLIVGALGLLAIAPLGGHSIRLPRKMIVPMIAVGLFNVTGWHILSGFAITLTSSGHAAIVGYTMPVWGVLLGALFLHEPLTWRRLLSLALGMAGLVVLIVRDLGDVAGLPLGVILMAGAALSWAIGTIGLKRVDWGMATGVLVAWQCLIGGLPIALGAVIFESDRLVMPSLWPLLALIYNVIFAFVIGHYLYFKVVQLFPVGIATIGTLPVPMIGLVSGALVLGEPLGASEIIALLLVCGALAVPVITSDWALRRFSGRIAGQ